MAVEPNAPNDDRGNALVVPVVTLLPGATPNVGDEGDVGKNRGGGGGGDIE